MYKRNRRRLAKAVSAFMAAALVLTSVPAGAKKNKKKEVTQIQVTSPYSEKAKKVTTTLTLKKGSTFKIKTSVSPKTASKKLVYKSSKKKIATVSKSGKIKAKKVGKTTITIRPKSNKKVKAVIQLSVVKKLKKVKKIALNKSSLSLSLNGNNRSAQLKASIVSPKKPTVKKFNWFTSDKKVVSVNNKGVVTAKKVGSAKITVTSADGRGAKAVCKVTVSKNSSNTPSVTSSSIPKPIVSKPPIPSTPAPFALQVPDGRTGIKQGESIQFSASGVTMEAAKWSVSEATGVTISERGMLSVASDVPVGTKIVVTVTATIDNIVKTDSAEFTVVENQTPVLTDKQIKLNQSTMANPPGLTYRHAQACTVVQDAERGNVARFDASKGYTSNANDVLAWMVVDPMYAGKTVTISAYLKFEASEDDLKEDENGRKMNLIINENWSHENPAKIWNAEPEKWYHVTGTYKLPEYRDYQYDGNRNRLYIARSADKLNTGKNAVYYIDDLQFTVEKADVTGVTLTAAENKTEIYQNHTLQFSAEVTGTNVPMQKVTYSISPAVEGATIDANGLLDVKNVPKDTEITVRAVSYEDNTKFAEKKIKVLAQTVDSVTVSAKAQKVEGVADEKDSPTEIYAGQPVQFTETVTGTGEPDESVTWSVTPATAGVTISADGLLSVTDAVTDNTNLSVKATSKFDSAKSGTYDITVKKNVIKGVTVSGAGDKNTVSAGLPLSLSAKVDKVGILSDDVTWSIPNAPAGVTFTPAQGKTTTLSVAETVSVGTQIKVRATSKADSSKFGEFSVTVQSDSEEFDINRCNVEYWEDFDGAATQEELTNRVTEAGILSEVNQLDTNLWEDLYMPYDYAPKTKEGAMNGCFTDRGSYYQVTLKNEEDKEKIYALSFMISIIQFGMDTGGIGYAYQSSQIANIPDTPVKLISVNAAGKETVLQENINIPLCCSVWTIWKDYYNISTEVKVPAGETLFIRLKYDGELPSCCVPDDDIFNKDDPHPLVYEIENVAISSSKTSTITMNVGEEYQLNLDTVDGDEVTYYTNSQWAQENHNPDNETNTTLFRECHNFDTTVANVDETGKITANSAGETALIVEIKRGDEVIRKQCIVKVTE